jgi:hypothetical protein
MPSCHTTTAAYNLQARDLVINRTQRSTSQRRAASKPRKRYKETALKKIKAEKLASTMETKLGQEANISTNKQFTRYHHARIAKLFFETPHQELYFGSVVGECGNGLQRLWTVQYDDGDLEDWNVNEVELGLETWRQHQQATEYNLWQVFNIKKPTSTLSSKGKNRESKKTLSMTSVAKFHLFLLEQQRCWIQRKAHNKVIQNAGPIAPFFETTTFATTTANWIGGHNTSMPKFCNGGRGRSLMTGKSGLKPSCGPPIAIAWSTG